MYYFTRSLLSSISPRHILKKFDLDWILWNASINEPAQQNINNIDLWEANKLKWGFVVEKYSVAIFDALRF